MTEAIQYVVCLECGGRNRAGDDFCGDCGAYLAWDEDSAPADGASDGPAEGQPIDSPAAAGPPSPTAETPGAAPDADAGRRVDTGAPAPTVGLPDAAQPQPMPTASSAPASEGTPPETPALRKPSAAAAPRRRPPLAPAPAEPAPAPGDLICPACGAGNRPERHFCRRCAAQLAAPVVAAASVQPTAGARPKGRNTRFPFTAVIVLAAVLGLIVVAWLNRDIVVGFVETIIGFVFSSQSQ